MNRNMLEEYYKLPIKCIRQFDECMDNFDWDKVHKAMEMLNWKWVHVNNPSRIPSIADMKILVRWIAPRAVLWNSVSTGGFTVEYFKEKQKFVISFVLEQSESLDEQQ